MYSPEKAKFKKQCTNIVSACLTLVLFSCSNHSPAPIVDLSYPKKSVAAVNQQKTNEPQITETYQVKPGDTLFSIAWRYSLDFKELARINQLREYRIYPGQELKLNIQDDQLVFSSESLLAAIDKEILNKSSSRKNASSKSAPNKKNYKVNRASQKAVNRKVSSSKTSRKASSKSSRIKSNRSAHTSSAPKASAIKSWIWPVNGKIINHFSAKSNQSKGVDIAAKLGEPVRATAKGRVVYSGNGLRGYGQLVIIKHNDNYLSAYAHNNKLHVEEDEFVKAGQRIADLGSSGADREKLHFEIRYKGKPVDPLNYLPKSGVL